MHAYHDGLAAHLGRDEAAPLQNHDAAQQPPLLPSRHGSHHWPPEEPGPRQYTDHHRPRMLPGRHLPSLSEDDHGPPNSATLLPTPLPVVWAPPPANLGPRSPVHLPLWT